MIAALLNPAYYQTSLFALPTILSACVTLALGLLVLRREQHSQSSIAFFIMTASATLWLLAYSMMYCAVDASAARGWGYIGHLGVIAIPASVYRFSVASLQISHHHKRRVWLIWQLAAAFAIALFWSDEFVAGIEHHSWGYYPTYGWLGALFVFYFCLVMFQSLKLYWTAYRDGPHGHGQGRAKGLFTAFAIASLGALDFLPSVGIPLYPFGYLALLGFSLLADRAIGRYRLVNITPEFAAEQIIDAMDDALFVLDSDAIVRVANRSALAMFSQLDAPLIGSQVNVLAELLSPNEPGLGQKISQGTLRDYVCNLNRGSGPAMVLSISAFATGDREAEPLATVCTLRDITERKLAGQQIELQSQRQNTLYEFNLAASSTLDLHALLAVLLERLSRLLPGNAITVVLLNSADKQTAKVASLGIDDDHWKAIHNGPSATPHPVVSAKQMVSCADLELSRGGIDAEFFGRDGFRSYLGVPLIANDQVIGVLSFYARAEHPYDDEELRFLGNLAGLTAVAINNSQLFEQARHQAQELAKANQVKEDFLSVMSHELRTPLNVISGYTKLVQEGVMGAVSDEQNRALEKVSRHANELLFMVTSIMHATRIEAGILVAEKQQFELSQFLDDLKSIYDYPHGREFKLTWDYPADLPAIVSDQDKLKHIVQNLINNAMKFTERGTITIFARALVDRQRAAVEIAVTDTGIGIAADEIALIFDRFRQADSSRTRTYGGVGLGLHIVKSFTAILGGEVCVTSTPGRGSTFTVRLPCDAAQESITQPQARESNP